MKNTKKNTNNNLATAAAKRKKTTNKVVKAGVKKKKSAAQIKKEAKIRNAFRRALYRANQIINSHVSRYKHELSMKEFKSEYKEFGEVTGMLKGKTLEKNLKIFVDYAINKKTPDQCKAAAANLRKHLSDAVRSLNRSKGGIETIDNAYQRYIQVLIESNSLRTKKNEDGKTVYSIIWKKVPNKEDFINVSDKYLKFKRIIIKYFGDKEYEEAYGS